MHAWLIAALVVSWALVFALAGALVVLIRQHGELIMYQQDLDHRLEMSAFFEGKRAERGEGGDVPHGTEMQGLPVGTPAPDFALQTLEGAERTLADYEGKPFVLAFFSDTCGYCKTMAPVIGQIDKKGRQLVLISHGDKESHEQMAAENKWHSDVLIEPEYDLMSAYMAMGTPAGYLIDDQGRIASPIALGADPVLDLLKADPMEPAEEEEPGGASEDGQGNGHVPDTVLGTAAPSASAEGAGDAPQAAATGVATALRTRGLSESNVVRDGLPAGTIAPNFVLQDLDGKTHALVDYRGKRVLLVFSDTHCGPCEAVSPGLVELAEKNRKKLQVLMISRGDLEENKRKAEAFGFPFPVMRQKAWEISKLYGMFATPIAFLIDENGIIEKDVATGPEPILELV
jgi:peroxiredoxin